MSVRHLESFSLSKADSNHHKQNQNLLCYHYTIGHRLLNAGAKVRNIWHTTKLFQTFLFYYQKIIVLLSLLCQQVLTVNQVFSCNRAILVGVGNIGHALMDNFSFAECGVELAAAFDIKESLIGTEFKGVPILAETQLEEYLKTHDIAVAVLCVPKEVAVNVTKILTDNGIEAIWNFTNMELTEPNSPIIVENVHFSDSLLSLSYFVSERLDERAAEASRNGKA